MSSSHRSRGGSSPKRHAAHRGRKSDPLYRCRRLLTKADERLDGPGRTKLRGLLDAGDPHGEVRAAWHDKEVVRSIYDHHDPDLALEFVDRLGHTSKTSPAQSRCAPWAEPSSVGAIRSRHGTRST